MAQAIVLGPGLLGKEAFEAQQKKLATEGGAIGIGPEFDKPFVPAVKGAAPKTVITGQPPLNPSGTPLPANLGEAQARRQAILDAQRAAKDAQMAAAKAALEAKIAAKAERDAKKKKAQPGKASAPPAPPKPEPVPPPQPAQVSFSEAEAQTLLTNNPQEWKTVLEAEVARPEGPRPAVAALVLALPADVLETIPAHVIQAVNEIVNPTPPQQ